MPTYISSIKTKQVDTTESIEEQIRKKANPLLKAIKDDLEEKKAISKSEQRITGDQERKQAKERLLQVENMSRRINLKFWGLNEQRNESKIASKRSVMNLLAQVGINYSPMAIQSAQRIWMKTGNRDRAIFW